MGKGIDEAFDRVLDLAKSRTVSSR
jgi:hypothetical protein